jgi:hypothetical protein
MSEYPVGSRIVAAVDIRIRRSGPKDGVFAGDHGTVVHDDDQEDYELTILMDRLIPANEGVNTLLFVKYRDIATQIKPEAPEIEHRRAAAHSSRSHAAYLTSDEAYEKFCKEDDWGKEDAVADEQEAEAAA